MVKTAQLSETIDPVDGRQTRRAAMIDVAREFFFEHGYGSTTMSAIAAKIGGSKTTLWTYFPSKQVLFEAVVDDLSRQYGSLIDDVRLPSGDLERTLTRFGQAVVETMLSPPVLQIFRMIVGEAGRFPELGRVFHDKGSGISEGRLTEFLRVEMAEGRLRPAEPEIAARNFLQLCQSNHFQKALLCLSPQVSKTQIRQDVESAVGAFLQIYAPKPTENTNVVVIDNVIAKRTRDEASRA